MHSLNFLQNEIVYNIDHVTSAIGECRTEQEQLSCNLQNVKNAIGNACERYVEKIQLHAAWLVEDATSAYQNKYNTLTKKIMELEEVLLDYTKSLDEARQSNDAEARDILNNVMNKSFQRNEINESLSHEEIVFEESVIHQLDFGKVVSRKKKSTNSFTDSDFEILPKRSKIDENIEEDIELQVKSIEMYHLTSESASIEERHVIDEIELELKDLNLVPTDNLKIFSKENDLSQWLRVTPYQERPMECDARKEGLADDNIETRVTSWLLQCVDEQRDWSSNPVDRSSTYTQSKTLSTFDHFDSFPISHWLVSEPANVKTVPSEESTSIRSSSSEWLLKPSIERGDESVKAPPLVLSDCDTDTDTIKYLDVTRESTHSHDIPPFIKHMNFIQSQPYHTFLRRGKSARQRQPSFCDWLVGKSNERCADCTETCTFDNSNSSSWLKTATDW